MICPKCNTVNDENEKYCRNCGFQLSSSRVCPNCNSVNKTDSKFCHKCGTTLSPVNTFKKDIIEENTKSSLFSAYKIPIICGLVILLALGAVAGVTIFGSGNGDDGFNSIIPLSNDTFQDSNLDDTALNHDNDTNQSDDKNLTEDTKNNTKNTTKNATAKNENKNVTKNTDNDKNKSKVYTEKTDKTAKSDTNKESQGTVKDNTKSDSTSSSNQNKNTNKNKDKEKTNQLAFGGDDEDESNDTDDALNESDDTASTDEGEENDEANDTAEDSEDDTMGDSIKMTDVPNLAQQVVNSNFKFSTISYMGHEFTQAQCIDIFSKYILNIESGDDSDIEIKSVSDASDPSGADESQTIGKSDYLSIANRVHSWIDSNNQVPNYVGVSTSGQADLSPDKMLELFSMVILNFAVTEELPDSVDI